MADAVSTIVRGPVGNVLVAAGVCFVALALIGSLKNWFRLSPSNRYVSGGIGALMVAGGIALSSDTQWPDLIADVEIFVDAATPAQPTTVGRFYVDGTYKGSITQTHQGGGKLKVGPLSRGEHQFTLDLDFDPPFKGLKSYSCAGTFTISGPSLLVPVAHTNAAGALTDCTLTNRR